MRAVVAIARKELRVYLTTWTSYVLVGVFFEVAAFFFYVLVSQYQALSLQYLQQRSAYMMEQMNLLEWVLRPVMSNIAIFFVFMLPVLTMRLLAEERKQKTLELLMTAPVRPVEIVLGKYLAGIAMMGCMLGLTLVFPVLLEVYGGGLDWSTVAVAYGGTFLLGAACVAVGLFTSAVTESQVVSVILGIGALIILWVIGAAAQGTDGATRELLQYLSLLEHLEGFLGGLIRLSDVVYYLSIVMVGLFLTYRVVEAHRWR